MLLDYSREDSSADSSNSTPDVSSTERVEKGHYLDFRRAYCGRLLGVGGMREVCVTIVVEFISLDISRYSICAQELRKYDLKKRFYLGPTSLDHSLGLIMSTISGVKSGSVVLDPFVGTASILESTEMDNHGMLQLMAL